MIQRRFDVGVLEAVPERKAWHALSSPREMIARPKMSQNEWKTTEIRASKVGQRLTLFLPRYSAYFAHAHRRTAFDQPPPLVVLLDDVLAAVEREHEQRAFAVRAWAGKG